MTNEEAMADTTDATASTQENEQANDIGEETVGISEKYAQYEVDGVMVINDDIFADWYCDVYDNLDEFVGKKCQYLTQVYSMEDFEENQFLAGRYFMVCCAADLVGYGIVCETDIRSELKDEEWITVEQSVVECFQSVSSGKSILASAITDKGVPADATASFSDLATIILLIPNNTTPANNPAYEIVEIDIIIQEFPAK